MRFISWEATFDQALFEIGCLPDLVRKRDAYIARSDERTVSSPQECELPRNSSEPVKTIRRLTAMDKQRF
jgi:hypothetical protein